MLSVSSDTEKGRHAAVCRRDAMNVPSTMVPIATVAASAGPFDSSDKLLRLAEKSRFLGSISCQ